MGGRNRTKNRVKDDGIGRTGGLLTNNRLAYQAHAVCRSLDGQGMSKTPRTAHGVCLLPYQKADPANRGSFATDHPNGLCDTDENVTS